MVWTDGRSFRCSHESDQYVSNGLPVKQCHNIIFRALNAAFGTFSRSQRPTRIVTHRNARTGHTCRNGLIFIATTLLYAAVTSNFRYFRRRLRRNAFWPSPFVSVLLRELRQPRLNIFPTGTITLLAWIKALFRLFWPLVFVRVTVQWFYSLKKLTFVRNLYFRWTRKEKINMISTRTEFRKSSLKYYIINHWYHIICHTPN